MIGFMQLMNLCSFLIKTLKKEHIELISFDSSGEREREREREREKGAYYFVEVGFWLHYLNKVLYHVQCE